MFDRVARHPEPEHRPHQRERDVGHDDDHAPRVAKEQQDHQPGQDRADQALAGHALDRRQHGRRLVELEADGDVLGDDVTEELHRLADVGHDVQSRRRVLLDDRQVDRFLAVDERVAIIDVGIVADCRHVADVDVLAELERDLADVLDIVDRGVGRGHRHRALDVDVPRRDHGVPLAQGLDDVPRRQVVGAELVGVEVEHDRPHVRTERRDRDRAGDIFLHQRPDDVLRQVAQEPQRGRLALHHEVADGDAAGVHAHDHRRQRPLGHPRHGPVGHGDHLRHRLAHVGAGEERELAERDLLDVPRVDVLDAVDVLEIELELVDDEPLHLGGAHADVIEEDVDLRRVQRREDIHPHLVEGEDTAADQGHDQHQGRDRMPHREDDRIHDRPPRRARPRRARFIEVLAAHALFAEASPISMETFFI